ncbi:hypothetical protein L873DRAFT_1816882 [Choiromyces venosus 120613-1]|uniref:Uncharacterized protein n=1 Tax=Choiromyces venosus 120613-1 TaxID=1336337 RepID=A0A3N4J8D3_9PEZI|nr:hypothetical protein L873DRAFT_1816882 [Choiromyces venosus 120613-1]
MATGGINFMAGYGTSVNDQKLRAPKAKLSSACDARSSSQQPTTPTTPGKDTPPPPR